MRKQLLFTLILLLPFCFSCKKLIEEKKKDIIVEAMVSGRWLVTEYNAAGVDVTSEFLGYEFQFYEDGKVEGIKSSTIKTGTWAGDVNALTITSNFPSGGLPLSRLNAVWQITNSDWTFVHSFSVSGSDTNYLKLTKKQ